jgi:ABC-type polysaccharide/polyol phosphate export permease
MNLFLMPMWFLSGALFPPDGAWAGLKYVMLLNPLTYGLAGLRRALLLPTPDAAAGLPGPGLATALIVSLLFAIVLYWAASAIARRPSAADLH